MFGSALHLDTLDPNLVRVVPLYIISVYDAKARFWGRRNSPRCANGKCTNNDQHLCMRIAFKKWRGPLSDLEIFFDTISSSQVEAREIEESS